MMLLLTHLLTGNPEWSDARVVVRSIVLDPNTAASREAELASGLKTTIFVRNAGEFAGRLVWAGQGPVSSASARRTAWTSSA